MANERTRQQRARLALAIMEAVTDRAVYGSYRFTFVEGRDADLCKDLPYNYSNFSVIIGEEGHSQFVCTVDLLDRDKTEEGISQLVTFGLLPAYFDANDEEGER